MPMMTLIDLPGRKVELRHDIYHDHEICPTCKGSGRGRYYTIGNIWFNGVQISHVYPCTHCGGNGYVKKSGAYR